MKVTVIAIVVGFFGIAPKNLWKRLDEGEIRRRIEIILIDNAVKISSDTEKSQKNLRRLVVTQIPVEGHQL